MHALIEYEHKNVQATPTTNNQNTQPEWSKLAQHMLE